AKISRPHLILGPGEVVQVAYGEIDYNYHHYLTACWNRVKKLVEMVEIIMNAEQYCEILDDRAKESFEKLEMEEGACYFQQDNDTKHNSKHNSKRANKWYEDNNFDVLWWPAQSLDLHPIEHLWEYLKEQLKQYETPYGVHESWERVAKEWDGIPAETQGAKEERRMHCIQSGREGGSNQGSTRRGPRIKHVFATHRSQIAVMVLSLAYVQVEVRREEAWGGGAWDMFHANTFIRRNTKYQMQVITTIWYPTSASSAGSSFANPTSPLAHDENVSHR
ncbi:hypothetical protein E4T56_gene20365, partial [Termitomyces sp. T112]